tara:strand:- start:2095 stop:2199 length:105 start_codon:yes stop_codon:yes gene_type:complete
MKNLREILKIPFLSEPVQLSDRPHTNINLDPLLE